MRAGVRYRLLRTDPVRGILFEREERMEDEKWMRQALSLAGRGAGRVNPNPLVGAVLVKDGICIGEGWHVRYGEAHAERNALAACQGDATGATLYVTLEPCCHVGKTPPCTDAILQAKIKRVVVGSVDPNPLVAGKGLALLRQNEIEVTTGVLREACDRLNAPFFHLIRTQTPYVVLKYAMTLDGKLATRTGNSRWITGEAARARVHADRNRYAAIMVGVGTVLQDDPLLTCRIDGGRNPLRIICDSHLRTPLSSRIVQTARTAPTLLATCEGDPQKHQPFCAAGCEVCFLPSSRGRVDLIALMQALGARGIDSVLLEGGAALHGAALDAGIVTRVQCYLAPKLFGGAKAKAPVGGLGAADPADAVALKAVTVTSLGEDLLIEGEVLHHVHRNC